MKKAKSNIEEERWSQLPALLLWKIKDLLNIADNFRLAFVCSNWKSMSSSYPGKNKDSRHLQQGDVPWVMYQSPSYPTASAWDFVNVWTKERFTLELPDCYRCFSKILFSKQGWVLYQNDFGGSIFLFNLHTNEKIIIQEPPTDCLRNGFITSISFSDEDSPQCVVLVPLIFCSMKIYIANVDTKKWTEHSYEDDRRSPLAPINVVVHGHKLYLFCQIRGLFCFDMANLLWKKLAPQNNYYHEGFQHWLMEWEGEIVKIERCIDSDTFNLFKLNDSQNGWEELSSPNNHENRSWFLYDERLQTHQFCVKEGGREGMGEKVYYLARYCQSPNDIWTTLPVIHIHDLISRSVQDYKLDQYGMRLGIWIDLGCINKMPPSCVSVGVIDSLSF